TRQGRGWGARRRGTNCCPPRPARAPPGSVALGAHLRGVVG
ncbi:unnamed protein product, partial [Leptosia nina]